MFLTSHSSLLADRSLAPYRQRSQSQSRTLASKTTQWAPLSTCLTQMCRERWPKSVTSWPAKRKDSCLCTQTITKTNCPTRKTPGRESTTPNYKSKILCKSRAAHRLQAECLETKRSKEITCQDLAPTTSAHATGESRAR